MSLRASELLPLAGWLEGRLRGAVLQEVRVPEAAVVVLELRVPGETVRLLVCAEPGRGCFFTVPRAPPGPARQHAFQGLLRKELHGAVLALSMPGGDRALRIDIGGKALVALLWGAASDVLLLDGEERVLGSARGSRARGSPYVPPKPGGRPDQPDRFAPKEGPERDAAVRAWADGEAERLRRAGISRQLLLRLAALERTASRQRAEAERAAEADDIRTDADLLSCAWPGLRRGLAGIEVEDLFRGGVRTIQLLPALDPAANVARLYARAARARRAGEQAGWRLAQTLERIGRVRDAMAALEDGEAVDLADLGLDAARPGGGARRQNEPRLPYRVYRAPGGAEIRVGRSARDNDDLVFRHSRGRDVWLHVRGRRGPHVVLRDPGPSPSPELLLLAAQVVLHHGRIPSGCREEVTWTRVSEIRKPRGMPGGAVIPRAEKTLWVQVDPEELAKLEKE